MPPARQTRVAAKSIEDRLARAWAHCVVIEEAFAADRAGIAREVAQYAEWANRIGAPSIRSDAAFYEGQALMSVDPPQATEALAAYQHGLDLARHAGDLHEEGKNALGVMWATTVLRTGEAAGIAYEALLRLYDNRHWSLIWTAIEIAAGGLLRSDPEIAALIYGQLEAHHPTWGGGPAKQRRASAMNVLRTEPRADHLKERGAAMTDEQVISLALDQLARAASLP